MVARDQNFQGIRISLDGETFIRCTFDRCNLVYSGLLPVTLQGSIVASNCQWELAGSAALTVGFLTDIYSLDGAGPQMIEKLFDTIRADATGQPPQSDTVILN